MALEQNAGTAIGDSTSVARGILPPLSDHACFIFVPIRLSPGATLAEAELTLQDRLTAASRVRSDGAAGKPPDALPWLAASERETLLAEGRQTRIWEPAPMNVGPDLYPHVRRMLGDAATANDTNALCFRLADLPRRLLQGRSLGRRIESEQGPNDKQARRKLVLLLSASARSRMFRSPLPPESPRIRRPPPAAISASRRNAVYRPKVGRMSCCMSSFSSP